MTKVGLLYRVPALVIVDLESSCVECVALEGEITLSHSAGAYAEDERTGVLRGAERGEVARALCIAAEMPWPEATVAPASARVEVVAGPLSTTESAPRAGHREARRQHG